MQPIPAALEAKWRKLLQIFHNESLEPYGDSLTPTQVQIIDIIAKRRYNRTQLILPTQYGKSLSVSFGVLLRVATHKEKWAIIAPTEEKARIIMDYIIDHIFDDPIFSEQLEYHGTKEKLKQERSKVRITFRNGGEVRVYSGNASNTKATKSALMGFGAANIILDESALISDELYSTVKRMLGGTQDNFLLEIGNPFYRNHFYRTWHSDRYKKVYVDVYTALKEGRYTEDYINEMRDEAFFDVLYECLFPDSEQILPNGYRRLMGDLTIDEAIIDTPPEIVENDKPVLGIDVAGTGSNQCKWVVRYPKSGFAQVVATSDSDDLEEIADITVQQIKAHGITDYRTMIDAGGVGHGLPAILRQRGYLVQAILFGDKAPDKAFNNMRAWMYWESRRWLKSENGRLVSDNGFQELKLINYKQNSSLKLQIEPKEKMIKRELQNGNSVESPDTADAFVLTFVDTRSIVEEEDIVFD